MVGLLVLACLVGGPINVEPPNCEIHRLKVFGPESWRLNRPDQPWVEYLVPVWRSLADAERDWKRTNEEADRSLYDLARAGSDRERTRIKDHYDTRRSRYRMDQLRRGEFFLVEPRSAYFERSDGHFFKVRLDDPALGPPRVGWVAEQDLGPL